MADIGWRTINGSRVYLGEKGNVVKGPSNLVGKNISDIKSEPKKESKKEEKVMYVGQPNPGGLIYTQGAVSLMSAISEAKRHDDKVRDSRAEAARRNAAKKREERLKNPVQGDTPSKNIPKADSQFVRYNGYDVPKEFFSNTGQISSSGKKHLDTLIRQDPSKSTNTLAVKRAFSAEFKKAGLSSEVQSDAAMFMTKGMSFESAVKKALQIEANFVNSANRRK